MAGDHLLHGAKGWGSVIVEGALTLMGQPYRIVADLADGALAYDGWEG